jgi:hypothetical protein
MKTPKIFGTIKTPMFNPTVPRKRRDIVINIPSSIQECWKESTDCSKERDDSSTRSRLEPNPCSKTSSCFEKKCPETYSEKSCSKRCSEKRGSKCQGFRTTLPKSCSELSSCELDKHLRTFMCHPPQKGCCYTIIYYQLNPWDYFVGRFFGLW